MPLHDLEVHSLENWGRINADVYSGFLISRVKGSASPVGSLQGYLIQCWALLAEIPISYFLCWLLKLDFQTDVPLTGHSLQTSIWQSCPVLLLQRFWCVKIVEIHKMTWILDIDLRTHCIASFQLRLPCTLCLIQVKQLQNFWTALMECFRSYLPDPG